METKYTNINDLSTYTSKIQVNGNSLHNLYVRGFNNVAAANKSTLALPESIHIDEERPDIITFAIDSFKGTELETLDIQCESFIIDDGAFSNCYKLKNINLGSEKTKFINLGRDSLSNIAAEHITITTDGLFATDGAFYSCGNLKTVTINLNSNNIDNVGFKKDTFLDSKELKSVIFHMNNRNNTLELEDIKTCVEKLAEKRKTVITNAEFIIDNIYVNKNGSIVIL